MEARKCGWWAIAAVLAALIAVLCVAQAPQVPQVPQVPGAPPAPLMLRTFPLSLTAASAILRSTGNNGPAQRSQDRWAAVKTWNAHFRITVDESRRLEEADPEGCSTKQIREFTGHGQGEASAKMDFGIRDTVGSESDTFRWDGEFSGNGQYNHRMSESGTDKGPYDDPPCRSYTCVTTLQASGPIECGLQLSIDLVKRTYSFGGCYLNIKNGQETTECTRAPKHIEKQGASLGSVSLEDLPLPSSGLELSGSRTLPTDETGEDKRVTVTWNFSPPGQEELEVVVSPVPLQPAQSYEQWLPEGGADEKTAGNAIAFKAKLQTKDGKPPRKGTEAAKFRFELVDVSAEPGVCLNWPIQGASQDKDLKFEAEDDLRINDAPQNQEAETKEGGIEASVVVSSFDWGASGKLKVSAILAGGRQIVGYLEGHKEVKEILIPKREESSKIADAWKKGVGGKDDDDSEKQSGNKNDGDGFTLFEEYRGVMAKGKHQYLDPKKKDLIVENQVGPVVAGGLGLFQKASGIRVVELKQGELGQQRLVNANHKTAHGGGQHGLRVVKATLDGDTMAKACLGTPAKSPTDCEKIEIDTAKISKLQAREAAGSKGQQDAASKGPSGIAHDTAHEMAHGVGVQHHGDHVNLLLPITLPEGSRARAFGCNGVELTRPITIEKPAEVGQIPNDASGNVNCIMTYNSVYQWVYIEATDSYHAMCSHPHGSIFCTSGTGTGRNAPGQKAVAFGDAQKDRGNCLGQMQVKDW